jgi:carboxyl-terminal processing protease
MEVSRATGERGARAPALRLKGGIVMLITFAFASFLLQEPSGNAATLAKRVVDAIDHQYLYAESGSWRALRSTLLAESSATASSLDRDLMRLNDGDLRMMTAEQMATMQAETAGDERGIGLVDFAVTLDSDTVRPQIVTPLVDSLHTRPA